MQPSPPELAETIIAAHRAAETADRLASIAIKMFIRKRAEAGAALNEARRTMAPR
jgi:hypothetical protein